MILIVSEVLLSDNADKTINVDQALYGTPFAYNS